MGMRSGQYWALTLYHAFQGISYVELGNKIKAGQILGNMFQITNEFENSFSRIQNNRVEQTFLLKFRQLDDVIKNTNEIINYIKKTDHDVMLLLIHCFSSMAYCFKGDIENARKHQQEAEELSKQFWIKYYVSTTLLARAYIEIKELELNLNQNYKEKTKALITTSKLLAEASQKVNCNKTEAYRIRAIAYVYAHKPKKAFYFFKKSIEFAKWYGAKLELSRTYFELGKFLSNPKTKQKQLNGLSGKDYLDKAKTMFEEMDLQWDLEEYKKFVYWKNS